MLDVPIDDSNLDTEDETMSFVQEDAITHPRARDLASKRKVKELFEKSCHDDVLPEKMASCFERFELPIFQVAPSDTTGRIVAIF